MALGNGAIVMRDVFFELYGRYPNAGETYSLVQLANDAGLPANLLAFRNFSRAVEVTVASHNWVVSYDYVDVTWIFALGAPSPTATIINVRETYTGNGAVNNFSISVPAGDTEYYYTSSYWREPSQYDVSMEILPGSGYVIGTGNLATDYVPAMEPTSSSSSSWY